MKSSIPVLIAFLTLFQSEMYAQGVLRVQAGAFLKVNGSAVIKLNNSNLDVLGSFSAGSGSVEFQGAGIDTIRGAQTLTFKNLVINGPSVKLLNQDIQVDSNMTFNAGTFDLNGRNLTLIQPNGRLVNESEASHIIGPTGGEVILSTSLNNPNASNPGNIGVVITSSSNLGLTTIHRGHTPLVLPALGNSVNRYFDITPTNNSNLNATLRFSYFDSELNGLTEGDLNLFRLNGSVWESGSLLGIGMQTRDAASNFVEKPNLEHLSTWRLAGCTTFSSNITGSATFCPGGNTTLDAGAGYSAYLWSTGATTQTLLVTTANTYTVTVSNANGCTNSASKTVTQNSALSPAIAGSNVFCVGQSTILDAGIFNTYLWSNNATTQTINVNVAATYTVTVTDANGCTGTDTQAVTAGLPVLPTITGPNSICLAGTAVLDAGAFSSYLWSNNANTPTITVITAGTYTVTVTEANGCTGTDTHVVSQNAALMPVITGSPVFCVGNNTVLDAGTGYASYSWSNNGTTQTIPVNIVGTYTVTVTDANGCTGTDTQAVTQSTNLSPVISGPIAFCPGTSIQLDAGVYSAYQWSNNVTTQTNSINTAGAYSVTVSNGVGCTGTASTNVTMHQAVTAATTAIDTLDCNNDQIILTATGSGLSFEWRKVGGNVVSNAAIASVDTPGDYQLIAKNNQTTCADTLIVTVLQTGVPLSGIMIDAMDPACSGDSNGTIIITSVATGTQPYQYALGAGGLFQSSNSFNQLAPGTYAVQVKGVDNCIAQEFVTLDSQNPLTASIEKPQSITEGETITLDVNKTGGTSPFTYAWDGPSISCTDCESPSVNPAFTSPYELTITDANGCTTTTSVLVEVKSESGTDIITPNSGSNETLTFPELDADPAKYEANDIVIFNRWGQVVYDAKPYKNEWNGVDKQGKELPEGTYYYLLLLRDGQKGAKFGNVLIIR